jgi:pectate lyase
LLTYTVENDWGPATINITQVGNFTEAPYAYALTPLADVSDVVKAGAGLGKIKV